MNIQNMNVPESESEAHHFNHDVIHFLMSNSIQLICRTEIEKVV